MALSTKREIGSYYQDDTVARQYVAVRFSSEVNRLLHVRQVAAVQRYIDAHAPARILEVAPGPGRLTRDVRTRGMLVCAEHSWQMIQEGTAACANGSTWLRGDGFQLPFQQAFDLLYTFRFVRHFHRADRDKLLAQFRRVLKPGGGLILDAVNERVSRPLREANPDEYPVYDKLYVANELRAELTAAGFDSIRLEPVLKNYRWQGRSQNLIGPRANWLNRLIVRGLEHMPRADGLEWIVTCRRV